jgi:hypothetical protein
MKMQFRALPMSVAPTGLAEAVPGSIEERKYPVMPALASLKKSRRPNSGPHMGALTGRNGWQTSHE